MYIQAKRYGPDHSVGRPEIQALVGALHGAQADRGVFIATSRFTPDARAYAERVAARLVLIDGVQLASLMILHNVGVQDEETFTLKRVDEDQFGPLRSFTMANSNYPNHTVLACEMQTYLRWRNANARHPDVLAAQRRERARIRSQRQQRWGRPRTKAV